MWLALGLKGESGKQCAAFHCECSCISHSSFVACCFQAHTKAMFLRQKYKYTEELFLISSFMRPVLVVELMRCFPAFPVDVGLWNGRILHKLEQPPHLLGTSHWSIFILTVLFHSSFP